MNLQLEHLSGMFERRIDGGRLMHSAIKRVLVYTALAAVFYAIAIFFVDSRTAFIAVFSMGLLLGLTAELIFWIHLFRLARKRRS